MFDESDHEPADVELIVSAKHPEKRGRPDNGNTNRFAGVTLLNWEADERTFDKSSRPGRKKKKGGTGHRNPYSTRWSEKEQADSAIIAMGICDALLATCSLRTVRLAADLLPEAVERWVLFETSGRRRCTVVSHNLGAEVGPLQIATVECRGAIASLASSDEHGGYLLRETDAGCASYLAYRFKRAEDLLATASFDGDAEDPATAIFLVKTMHGGGPALLWPNDEMVKRGATVLARRELRNLDHLITLVAHNERVIYRSQEAAHTRVAAWCALRAYATAPFFKTNRTEENHDEGSV